MLRRTLILSLLVLPWMSASAQAGEAYAAELPQVYPYAVQQPQPAAQVAVSTPYGYYYQAPAQPAMAPRPAAPAYAAPAAEPAAKKIDIMQMNSF